MDSANQIAAEIFNAALKAVDPYASVKLHTDKIRRFYEDNNLKKLIIAGFGKAAPAMARAMEDELPDLIDRGIVVTKYGHHINQKTEGRKNKSGIKTYGAGHPIPDENGLRATAEIIELVKSADKKTLVICLISGGGSALLVSPLEDIAFKEKQELTNLLLNSGANINELNTVRKHISKVKGGRLAETAYPAKIISLILSDVIGDRLDVIASGPTSPDNTTYRHAIAVLEKYGLTDKSPVNIIDILRKGAAGVINETPKEGNKIFKNVDNIIIGSNKKALEAAKTEAECFGLQTEIISSEITGEARDVGTWLAKKAIKKHDSLSVKRNEKICLISGGETTVTVKGNGLGGRNMELALSFAMEIEGINGITLLSAGTDGTDGPTDAAGAIVDGGIIKKAKSLGLDPGKYLANSDSYNFFKEIDGLFITGPTGTNVMDIQIVITH